MIRMIFATTDCGRAANCGGPVVVEHKTFELESPEIEAWLKQPEMERWTYVDRCFVGIEVIESPHTPALPGPQTEK